MAFGGSGGGGVAVAAATFIDAAVVAVEMAVGMAMEMGGEDGGGGGAVVAVAGGTAHGSPSDSPVSKARPWAFHGVQPGLPKKQRAAQKASGAAACRVMRARILLHSAAAQLLFLLLPSAMNLPNSDDDWVCIFFKHRQSLSVQSSSSNL